MKKKITQATYGSWTSPITPELLTASSPSYSFPSQDGEFLFWLESRPWENGRSVVVQRSPSGHTQDILPAPLNARSKVHEYGGSSYIVINRILYFCLYDDQRIYQLSLDSNDALPIPITPDNGIRYADFCYDQYRHRLICVAEKHNQSNNSLSSHHQLDDNSDKPHSMEPENSLVAIALDGSMTITTLHSGNDFYAYPRIDRTQSQLCWISWNHPDMPWDNTQLWLADIAQEGYLLKPYPIIGNGSEAIFQPQWSPDNQLYFVSDRSNWWNIYRWNTESKPSVEAIAPLQAEFATPLWVLGMSTYGFSEAGQLVCLFSKNGSWHLGLKSEGDQLDIIETNYTQLSNLYCNGQNAWFVAAATDKSSELVELNISLRQLTATIQSSPLPFSRQYLSEPILISFDTGGIPTDPINPTDPTAIDNLTTPPKTPHQVAHGFYYPPKNPEFHGIADSLPPLIVICHGGPTGATSAALNLKVQYWTSRGFAVIDINYRGSTGYGREYRQLLHGQWGIADVEDVVAAARYLINQQLVDPNKIAIRGSSAGGYTVLAALCFHDLFKAGACLYGIGDLETLVKDTHKFESRYLDKLIGRYPEQRATYQERSPINHIDRLSCPVIFFQGLEDKVVPPEQAITMTRALRDKKLPVVYMPFFGEGHGFRKAATIKISLEAELYFYSRIFNFISLETIPTIAIDNLPKAD